MADADDEIQEPSKSAEWLALIDDADRYFKEYLDSCDAIDKTYSSLKDLRNGARDQDFHLFWANIQVMGPSIYARPPQPVVSPKFADRRPVYRIASEMLERVASSAFDMAGINDVMIHCRDDLSITGRGVAWVRYEEEDGEQRVCIEHLDRRDFLHEPARKWVDVSWVARRGWLTQSQMRERFGEEAALAAEYMSSDDANKVAHQDHSKKCGVWEIWHKAERKVVWVTEGAEDVLDEGAPHLELEGFFPCPRPAYATLQRRSLIPIADVIYYKGQLDQINDLTIRIHALSNGLQMKGFYQGGGEIGEAIEAAMAATDDGRTLIPISSMAAFGSAGEPVVWLPIDMVATTLTACVELRRQLIEDVYQIIGLSDIMRGATQAEETLGAQQLKQQNGSHRVRDKQNELVRVARDLVRIAAEIIAENFDRDTLVKMAQMDIPTRKSIKAQVKPLEEQAKQISDDIRGSESDPQVAQMAQQNPEAAQQAMAQAQQQLQALQQQMEELQSQPTLEDVLEFLKDEKLRPFVLDIETDSTIYPDEMAEKANRAEFMQVFMGSMPAISQLAALGPQAISMAGAMLKFALAPYRVGRELEGIIDDFVSSAPQIAEQMQAQQGGGEDQQAMMQMAQAELKKAEAQTMKVQADAQLKMQELQLRGMEAQAKAQQAQEQFTLEVEDTKGKIAKTEADIQRIYAEIQLAEQKLGFQAHKEQREDIKAAADMQARATDQAMTAQFRAQDGQRAERQLTAAERAAQMGGRGNGEA